MLLVSTLASAQSSEEEGLLASAVAAQQTGNFQVAILDYQKVLSLDPKMVEARVNLGAALAQTGRLDEAIEQYRLALAAMPENSAVRMNLGIAYYKKGDFAQADREFQQVRKERGMDAQLAILMGDSEVKLGKGSDAAAALLPLEAADAANPDFEYVLGTALVAAGSRREGVARLEKVAQSTQSADAYFLAGSTLLDLNEAQAARVDLEAALALNPQLPRIQTLAGEARDKAGDAAAAESAFRAALKSDPNDFDANLYLGAILYKRRDTDEAKSYLDKALSLNPESTLARYELAMWKSTSGQYEAAAADLEAIVRADPDWLEPHVELATLYYRLHRPDDGAKEREIVSRITAAQQSKGPGKQ